MRRFRFMAGQRSRSRPLSRGRAVLAAMTALAIALLMINTVEPGAAESVPSATGPLTWNAPLLVDHQPPWASNYPHAVSCPSVTLCVAVDSLGNVIASTHPAGGASAWRITAVRCRRRIRLCHRRPPRFRPPPNPAVNDEVPEARIDL